MVYKVVVADDYRMMRSVFEAAIASSPQFETVASVQSGAAAVDYVSRYGADLVILDVVMPGKMNGLSAAREIKSLCPQTKILIVTSMPEVSYIQKAREIGVESFWYKEVQEQPILEIMERTMAGESVYPCSSPTVTLGNAVSTEFTERELEVLRELVGGASNKDIADMLCITENTVKMHVANMLQKTGFRSRLELAVKARADGLVIHD